MSERTQQFLALLASRLPDRSRISKLWNFDYLPAHLILLGGGYVGLA
jgi:hypothetical protein